MSFRKRTHSKLHEEKNVRASQQKKSTMVVPTQTSPRHLIVSKEDLDNQRGPFDP